MNLWCLISEVASAIRGAVTNAKLSLIHVVRGNWVSIAKKNAAVSAADENASVNKNHQQGLHTISGKVSPCILTFEKLTDSFDRHIFTALLFVEK